VDSSGLSVVVMVLKQTKHRGGQLVLVGLCERVRKVLEITGLTKIIDIRDALAVDEEFAVEWALEQPGLPMLS
jgi:anti-anti-sigma factor